ncbi:monocarboxylate transporter 12-like [Mytilus trossulus]|uniref:monocarboxylate transporter 12-like n=1 Tax=Mytilus trossulus TaxID=6551 RepID=UPI003006E906
MDSGYSWVILAGAFMNYMILTGVLKSFGILYSELLDQYDITSGQGALSGFLSTTFSFRGVTFVGGLLIGSGLCFSGLTSRPEMLFLTYSLLTGTGLGLCMPSSLSIVNFYFNKKRALASGIVTSAGGVSALIFPALYRVLFDSYGINGGLVLLGGIYFNVCVGSSLLRQPPQLRKITQFDNEHRKSFLNSCLTETSKYLGILRKTFKKILQNPCYRLYTAAFSFALVGYTANFTVIPPHLRSRGISDNDIVTTLMASGIGELISRIGVGYIVNKKYVKAETIFIANMGISGILSIVFPFFDAVSVNYTYSLLAGLLPGAINLLMMLMLSPVIGVEQLPSALSLSYLFIHTFYLIGMPFIGYMDDLTGNWNASFYCIGLMLILSAILVLIGTLTCNREHKSQDFKNGVTLECIQSPESKPMLAISKVSSI